MTKPAWSPAAFRIRVRMTSSPTLFLVTEGKETDPWFYEEIARRSETVRNHGYLVYPVEYATRGTHGSGGGKPQMVALYEHLREKRELIPRSRSGGAKAVMLLFDADHDVVDRTIIRSKHVTYTSLADAEAHLFDTCSLAKLISALCSVDSSTADAKANSMVNFRSKFATDARTWFELCLTARRSRTPGPRPGTKPPLNSDGSVNTTAIRSNFNGVSSKAPDPKLWAAALRLTKTKLRELFTSKQEDTLLKGKWIAECLQRDLDGWAASKGYGRVATSEAVIAVIRALADLDDSSYDYYRARMEKLII